MDNRLAGEYIENSILSPLQITLARLMFAKEAFLCNSSLLRSVVGSHSGRHGAFHLYRMSQSAIVVCTYQALPLHYNRKQESELLVDPVHG